VDQAVTEEWPEAVERWFADELGGVEKTEPLGGMSGAAVWRIRGPRGDAVVKRSGTAFEGEFFKQMAAELRQRGVPVVRDFATVPDGQATWLILEWVPEPLPRNRFLADPELLGALRRLHEISMTALPRLNGGYAPSWPAEMNDAALSVLPDGDELAVMLDELRSSVLPLFAPQCPISGDPNPVNRGPRTDGSLVLFDWERFTFGNPALDLAITVPGIGDPDAFRLVSERYGAPDAESLAREIALAKVWSVVEFLAGCAAAPSERTAGAVTWLRGEAPDWLRATARFAVKG
jgi:aminoglycoside phosphotransferase (APT) family kinase protein